MIRGLTKFVVLSALALVVAPGAMAQESWNWTLGLGAGAAPDYEGGDDYEAVPIPYFRAQKGYRYGELFRYPARLAGPDGSYSLARVYRR